MQGELERAMEGALTAVYSLNRAIIAAHAQDRERVYPLRDLQAMAGDFYRILRGVLADIERAGMRRAQAHAGLEVRKND